MGSMAIQKLHIDKLIILLSFISIGLPAFSKEHFSLDDAVSFAIHSDPLIRQYEARSEGLKEQAVFDNEFSDPKLKFGIAGLATDTFDRSQEAMTQLKFGLSQTFPKGRTLHYKSQKTSSLASREENKAVNREARIKEQVRIAYLDYLYQLNALTTIQEYRQWFEQLVEITQSHYASGRRNQQDVIQAQLELARLDDKDKLFETKRDSSASVLARWIGQENVRSIKVRDLPTLPALPQNEVSLALNNHPILQIQNKTIDAANHNVSQAKQSYWPGFSVDVIYGDRVGRDPTGDKRTDLLTAMIAVDLPIFPWDRQNKLVSSAKHQLVAEKHTHADLLLELKRQTDMAFADYQNLNKRLKHYKKELLPKSSQNVEAAMNAYQSGVSDFTDLLRARITELAVKLDELKLQTDKSKAQSTLLYLLGETT